MKYLLTVLILVSFFAKSIQSQEITTIGLLGCHVQDREAPSIPFFADSLQPDYAVWLGDNVYADTKKDANHIQKQLDKLAVKPGFQQLKATTPFFVTWDDHDYGLNNAGYDYPLKEESKAIHRNFWELTDKIPSERQGVYYAEIVNLPNGNSIHFIMLDGRYNKIDGGKKKAQTLGEEQWQWLENEIQKESTIKFIVSGYQVLLPKLTRWESWAKQGNERDRLIDLLVDYEVPNAIFLTGDQHTTEVLRSQRKLAYQTYEIMACGINQTEKPGRAPNRVMGPDLSYHSSPIIKIYWDDHLIQFKNYNAETHKIASSFSFSFDDIYIK